MAFSEKTKIKDFAKAEVKTIKKYRCNECGWVTRDEQEYEEHECDTQERS